MMRYVIASILILTSSVAYSNPYPAEIVKVIDGDTITIKAEYLPPELKQELKVRIVGIDTPEKAPRAQCSAEADLAKQASAHTKKLAETSRNIEVSIQGWDKYGGRILGSMSFDGVDLAQSLIQAGLARPYHGEKKQSWCK